MREAAALKRSPLRAGFVQKKLRPLKTFVADKIMPWDDQCSSRQSVAVQNRYGLPWVTGLLMG